MIKENYSKVLIIIIDYILAVEIVFYIVIIHFIWRIRNFVNHTHHGTLEQDISWIIRHIGWYVLSMIKESYNKVLIFIIIIS